jgi:hypothetical protein
MERSELNRKRPWLEYAVIALATLALWGHTAQFQFAWDDRPCIIENQSIRSWKNFPEMLLSRKGQTSLPKSFPLYRPVRTIAYAFLNQVGGGPPPSPGIYHIANIVGHIVAAVLLCGVSIALLQRFGGAPTRTARIAGMLIGVGFAVHPVNSEVVCWAKSLDDILATVFCLGALTQLLAWKEGSHARLWTALGLFVLAVYSKESAISFAVVALAYFWILLRQPFTRSLRLSGGFFVVAIVFVIHRHIVLGQTSQIAPLSGSYWQTLVDTVPCALAYVRLGFGVPPFTIVYTHLERGRALLSTEVIAGGITLFVGATIIILASRSERWRLLGFGLLWAAAFFVPVSNVVPMMQLMAERFMYLPLVGLLLATGLLLVQLPWARLAVVGACAGITLWSVAAWDRSWDWSNDLTLFVQTAMSSPGGRAMENNAVHAILHLDYVKRAAESTDTRPASASDVQRAIQALRKARTAFPQNASLANTMGVLSIAAGDLGKGIECFREAVSAAPADAAFCRNLGITLIQAGRLPEAEHVLRKLLQLHENDVPLLRMLCGTLLSQKRIDEAIPLIDRLKKLDPESPEYDQWVAKAVTKSAEESKAAESRGEGEGYQ